MKRLPTIDAIQTFVAIVERGRFNQAADMLGLTESAASHRLRKLEDALGLRLIERQREGAVLTDAGRRFHEKAVRALALLSEAVEETTTPDRRKVSLTMSRAFAAQWLMPRYNEFLDRNPEIELQLLITTRLCDLSHERIDFGIRYGDGSWPEMESIRLAQEVCFPVATPAVAQAWREAQWPQPPDRKRFLVNELHRDEWVSWCALRNRRPPDAKQCSMFESFDLVTNAALSGAGLAIGRRPLVDEYLTSGQLVAPFGTEGVREKVYCAVWPRNRPLSAPAKGVLRWIVSQIG